MPIVDPATALSLPALPGLPNPSAVLESVLASFPSLDAGQATAVVIPGAPVETTVQLQNPPNFTNTNNSWVDINRWLNGGTLIQNPATTTASTGPSTFTFGRVAAFILGIIFIGIGLMMFKPAQQIVARTVKTATL